MGFFSSFRGAVVGRPPLRLYNTLTKSLEEFNLPSGVRSVRMYNCGPTVYDTSHIGNLRSYVFADVLRRVLSYNGFAVKQVINITDFGHLSSDGDSGNDKMSKALKREGMPLTLENMRVLAERYTAEFIRDLGRLEIDVNAITFPRASDYIPAEIAMVKALEEKAYTYTGADGVYFDTSKYPKYGQLGSIDIAGLREGARVTSAEDKRRPTDFLLWKSDKKIGWDSPWGKGFPGWHIECSAMINATLGKQIDIHTGGIDLMPTHHNNEIAQSESATGKAPFSRFWLHHEFLNLKKEKISKSVGNVINLPTLIEKGFNPLAYRYYLLGAHYRTALDFSWEALEAAQTALNKLIAARRLLGDAVGTASADWRKMFFARINDDLDTPGALAVTWEMLKDKHIEPNDKLAGLLDFDKVLGLGLSRVHEMLIPAEVTALLAQREKARASELWSEADMIRDKVSELGYTIEDTPEGPKAVKILKIAVTN